VFILPLVLLVATSAQQLESKAKPKTANSAEAAQQNNPVEAASEQLAEQSKEAEGDETEQFKHSSSVQFLAHITGLSLEHAYWLAVLLNFAVLAGLLGWAMKKNLPGAFRDRTASIQEAMEEARQASAEANQRLSDVEARLSRLDTAIAAMREAAEKDAAAEMAGIATAADEDARKIVESAEQEISAAAKQARRELTAYAADLAVSLAQKQIHIGPSEDQTLIRGFAEHLGSGGTQKGGN
jgi:F-type H+-transporting ATPase subunit b